MTIYNYVKIKSFIKTKRLVRIVLSGVLHKSPKLGMIQMSISK